MIYTFIAYDLEGDLGSAYNRCMDLLKNDDDWAIFLDHDAMFVQPNWYEIISEALKNSKGYGCLTCVTNRIGSPWQQLMGVQTENHNIKYHKKVGEELEKQAPKKLIDATERSLMSGVVMVINKKCWDEIGGCSSGFLGVDNKIHKSMRDKGYKVGLLPNLYVYHWYRGELEINKARIKYR